MAAALEASRERYARLRAPGWVPASVRDATEERERAVVEHSAAALAAYYRAEGAVRVRLADGSSHVGWIESVYSVHDTHSGRTIRGAALLVPVEGDGVAFDLTLVRSVAGCAALADRV